MQTVNAAAAAGGGGGAAPDLGWTRFLIDGQTKLDPLSQEGSITEDADKTRWTSASSITINTGNSEQYPNHGACYVKALTDPNGDALTWSKAWSIAFLIETVEANRVDLKDTKISYGFGLADSTTDIANGNCLGYATTWTGSGSSYQRQSLFRKNAWNTSGSTPERDIYGFFIKGPRYLNQPGHFHVSRYRYDPDNPTSSGDTGLTFHNHGGSRITGTGPVYGFVTCHVTATISSAVEADFRIWYSTTGEAEWSIT